MGSGASVSEEPRPERPDDGETKPEDARLSTPAGRSDDTLQVEEVLRSGSADVKTTKPDGCTVDIQSVQSEEENNAYSSGNQEHTLQPVLNPAVTETVPEGEEVSLDFESFLHNNGTLYSCFSHHGNRVYVDESQNLQLFPKEWYNQGCFITTNNEGSGQLQTVATSQSTVREDDRTGSIYIQGKGTVMTYMFQERVNICRFWDPQSGVWLLLPLQWEMDGEFAKVRVQRVMSALPGLVDQKEITAALRQCNYDPDEVISVYLTIALLERDRVIEELRHKLQTKEKEVDNLFQRNSYLAREVRYLTDIVQHLNQKLAELEADQQEAREKIRSLLNRRAPAVPPAKTITKPAVDPSQLRQVSRLTRELNISNKQLRSTVHQALADVKNQLEQFKDTIGKLAQVEQEATKEVEELRSLYRKEAVERKSLYNKVLELQGNIRVFCRCRKSLANSCLEKTNDQEVVVIQKGNRKKFQFDKVYPPSSTQEDVFTGTLPVITSCVDGYNVCILAYGQTGSGKTYTMMGSKENPGVNIRSIRELLRICAEKEKVSYTLKISMLEIYNDTLNDLLAKSPSASLDIRVQGKSVSVPGLTQVQVQTEADILNVMEMGEKNRKIASTKMNIQSSRSHLVVALEVEGSDEVSGLTSRGTLTLCDLAGSERISKTEAEGQRLVEAAAINKSLTALGQVFGALKCNALHIPFRNSKLTHLLQPCLSGDAKCCVFVNVSPDINDVVETLSTLQFGSTIRQVSLGKATQNIVPAKNNKTVK
ncbi:kinesin-like protein KIFC3 [Stegastes partitus]|uniref:Kinesin-like protein n=2 Tax=Stegastes partitus TaxID=144197 RepID=A0A9Y4KBL3_9TELE|nr:PREDICTED: kinesin-like protein KIFC3 [Stegastes partitus]